VTKRIVLSISLLLCGLSAQAATTQTSLAADSFTRANAANLGANWANIAPATCLMTLTSNSAETGVTGQTCFAIYNANDFPNDQFSQIKVATRLNSGNGGVCVHLMANPPTGAAQVSSAFGYCTSNNGSNYTVAKLTNGSFSVICTSGTALAAGDVLQLLVQQTSGGQALTLNVNGVATSCAGTIDNTYLNGLPGFDIFASTATTDVQITNFSGGAVSTPPTITNSGIPVISSSPLTVGSITGVGQAVQFSARGGAAFGSASGSFNYLGRLQIIANGQVSNPTWVLECSQDGGSTWFQIPAVTLPSLSPQLQDVPSGVSLIYDISGLGGAQFRFGLAVTMTTTVTGTVSVSVMAG
jgi:hypothetical protein